MEEKCDSLENYIKKNIAAMYSHFTGFNIRKEALDIYINSLVKYDKKDITAAIDSLVRSEKMPLLNDFIKAIEGQKNKESRLAVVEKLNHMRDSSANETRKVVYSFMHLYYEHGWGQEDIPIELLKKAHSKIFGDTLEYSFERLKSKLTKEIVGKVIEKNAI